MVSMYVLRSLLHVARIPIQLIKRTGIRLIVCVPEVRNRLFRNLTFTSKMTLELDLHVIDLRRR